MGPGDNEVGGAGEFNSGGFFSSGGASNAGVGGAFNGVGGAFGETGGADNVGGALNEAGGRFSGTGGAGAGLNVVCGQKSCNAKQLPLNYQALSTGGSRTALACCAGDASDRCGLLIDGGCVELGQVGSPNPQCQGLTVKAGLNQTTFGGCCKPDGTCGFVDPSSGSDVSSLRLSAASRIRIGVRPTRERSEPVQSCVQERSARVRHA